MAGHPTITQKIQVVGATTANGSSYGTCYFPPGREVCQVDFTNGSTGTVDFQVQGSNSTSAIWFDMTAAPTTVAAAATVRITSTATFIFDRLRILTTDASASTKSATYTWWLTAR